MAGLTQHADSYQSVPLQLDDRRLLPPCRGEARCLRYTLIIVTLKPEGPPLCADANLEPLLYYGPVLLQDGVIVSRHSTPKIYERKISVPWGGRAEDIPLEPNTSLSVTHVMLSETATFTDNVYVNVRLIHDSDRRL